jgi:hypothetical protein
MDNKLKQFFISCILGDGSFTKKGMNKFSKISIAHSIKQKNYIYFKYNLLKEYDLVNSICYNKIFNERYKNGFIEEYRFKSKPNRIFSFIRNNHYKDGKKFITYNFVKKLDAFGLALWYMDDGYITNNSCILSSCSFSLEEQKILQKVLLENFNIECTVGKNDNSMLIRAKSFETFVNIIKPYMLESFNYKLIPYKKVLDKSDKLLEHLEEDNQQPS